MPWTLVRTIQSNSLTPPAPTKKNKKTKNKNKKNKKKVKVSPRLPSTPSNHSSLPSNVLHLQGIHNTCSKHKIIQYLRNHVWHSWHLWPCNLPKTQNKFILIIFWSGDNKNNAIQRASAFTHTDTHRGKRKDVLQCCWKRVTNRAQNACLGTFYNAATKHADCKKRHKSENCGQWCLRWKSVLYIVTYHERAES